MRGVVGEIAHRATSSSGSAVLPPSGRAAAGCSSAGTRARPALSSRLRWREGSSPPAALPCSAGCCRRLLSRCSRRTSASSCRRPTTRPSTTGSRSSTATGTSSPTRKSSRSRRLLDAPANGGGAVEHADDAVEGYVEHIVEHFGTDLTGLADRRRLRQRRLLAHRPGRVRAARGGRDGDRHRP